MKHLDTKFRMELKVAKLLLDSSEDVKVTFKNQPSVNKNAIDKTFRASKFAISYGEFNNCVKEGKCSCVYDWIKIRRYKE